MAGPGGRAGFLLGEHSVKEVGDLRRDDRVTTGRGRLRFARRRTPCPPSFGRHDQKFRQQRREELIERRGVAGPSLLHHDDLADARIREGVGSMGSAKCMDQRGKDFRFEPGCFFLPIDLLQETDSPDGASDFTQRCAGAGCVRIEQWKKQNVAA